LSVAEELRAFRVLVSRSRRETINERESGVEELDPTPLEMPLDYGQPPSMRELVQQYVRGELSAAAAQHELGTFEEEDDFEEENPDLLDLSGYEVTEFEMVDEDPSDDPAPPGGEPSPKDPPEGPSEPSQPPETEAPVVGPTDQ